MSEWNSERKNQQSKNLQSDSVKIPSREEDIGVNGSEDGKKVNHKKTYINRADYMNSIKFPQNSQSLVVIPSNEKGTGFLRTCYSKEILDSIMDQEEFQAIVD